MREGILFSRKVHIICVQIPAVRCASRGSGFVRPRFLFLSEYRKPLNGYGTRGPIRTHELWHRHPIRNIVFVSIQPAATLSAPNKLTITYFYLLDQKSRIFSVKRL